MKDDIILPIVTVHDFSETIIEILWLHWLLKDLDFSFDGPTPLFYDNQFARHIANNPSINEQRMLKWTASLFVSE